MNKLTGFFCCSMLLLLTSTSASAQLYDKLVNECYKMNSVFADTGYQSFTIKYYFSTEKNAAYTDSLNASLKTNQGKYYGKFGNTVSVQNKQYLVTVYAANSSIMVSNPVKRNTSLIATANLDSAFLANDIDSAWITESGASKTIRFRFTGLSGYKSYTITYDKTNYQVQKIVYSLKQQLFNPGDTAFMPANPLITIQFSGYSKAPFSDAIFDQGSYIKKDEAGQFKGVGIYSSYQVMNTYQEPNNQGSGFLHPKILNGYALPLWPGTEIILPQTGQPAWSVSPSMLVVGQGLFKKEKPSNDKKYNKNKYTDLAI